MGFKNDDPLIVEKDELDCTVVATNKNIQLESHGQWIKTEVEWLGSSELLQPCTPAVHTKIAGVMEFLSPPNMVFTATKWSVPNKKYHYFLSMGLCIYIYTE